MITITTDFGYDDAYAAIMEGVIRSIRPDEQVIHITHNVIRHNALSGAYILKTFYRYFPEGSGHLVVVDPGVGTERKGLVVRSRNQWFVGPDSGVFSYLFRDNQDTESWLIDMKRYPDASRTFHGRDVFARELMRVIDEGTEGLEPFDRPISVLPSIKVNGRIYEGAIVHTDRFGNLITNIEKKDGTFTKCVRVGEESVQIPFKETYGMMGKGDSLLLLNSENHYEVAINQGNAAERFAARPGQPIFLEKE